MKILTLAKFDKENGLENDFEWREIIINICDVSTANEGNEGFTTIEVSSGFRQTVAIEWEKFKEIIKYDRQIVKPEIKYQFEEQ